MALRTGPVRFRQMVGGTGLSGNSEPELLRVLALAHEAPQDLDGQRRSRIEGLAVRRRGAREQHPELRQESALRDRPHAVLTHRGPLFVGDHPLRDRDDLHHFTAQVHLQHLEHSLVGIGQLFADRRVGRRPPLREEWTRLLEQLRDLLMVRAHLGDVERAGGSALLEPVPQELVLALVMRVQRRVEIGEPLTEELAARHVTGGNAARQSRGLFVCPQERVVQDAHVVAVAQLRPVRNRRRGLTGQRDVLHGHERTSRGGMMVASLWSTTAIRTSAMSIPQ